MSISRSFKKPLTREQKKARERNNKSLLLWESLLYNSKILLFYETDRRLYWQNIWFDNLYNMGCLCSRILTDSKNIEVLDFTPKNANFEYLRPRGHIIVQIDEKYIVPVLILDFGGCIATSVRLWPQNSV